MAQLSDDCFAFGGPMMSVDEAVGIITARVAKVVETETVSLVDADGRVLARDVAAPLPLPPFTNSAVDGYAVPASDLPRELEQAFPVTGRVQAGVTGQAAQPGLVDECRSEELPRAARPSCIDPLAPEEETSDPSSQIDPARRKNLQCKVARFAREDRYK